MRGSLRNTRGSRVAGSPFHVQTFRFSILSLISQLFDPLVLMKTMIIPSRNRCYDAVVTCRQKWFARYPRICIKRHADRRFYRDQVPFIPVFTTSTYPSIHPTVEDVTAICGCIVAYPRMQVCFIHGEMCLYIVQKFCRNRYHSRFSYYERKATMGFYVYHHPKNGSVLYLWEPRTKCFLWDFQEIGFKIKGLRLYSFRLESILV